MKKIIFLLILTFSFSGLSAQRVYKDKKDNKIYLDLSEESGVPPGVSTKTPLYAGTFTPKNDQFLVDVGYVNRVREELYYLLEIDSRSTYNTSAPAKGPDWVTAYNACESRNTGTVKGWRLPTRMEMYAIFAFREGIEKLSGSGNNYLFTPTNFVGDALQYWTISETSRSNAAAGAFVKDQYGFNSIGVPKNSINYTAYRCVHEVY